MGKKHWRRLRELLPENTTIVGIDELTSLIFWFDQKVIAVSGKGRVTLINQSKKVKLEAGKYYHLETLKTLKIIYSSAPKAPPTAAKPLAVKTLPKTVKKIIREHQLARGQKNFKLADKLRQKLWQLGYAVKDAKLIP